MFSWTHGIKYLKRQTDKIVKKASDHTAGGQHARAAKQKKEPKQDVDSGGENGRCVRFVHCITGDYALIA